jgi:anti-sigma B factor antagonist
MLDTVAFPLVSVNGGPPFLVPLWYTDRPTMIVDKKHLEGFTLLVIEGVIKLGESAQFFAQTLERALSADRGHVIVDFSQINYIDSTGIGELVGYLGQFKNQKRKLILVNPSERIVKLLQVARLAELFPIHPTVEAAIAAERGA